MGHAKVLFPRGLRSGLRSGQAYRQFLFGDSPAPGSEALSVYGRDAFSAFGCDFAGRSGKKAAAYIRQMAADLKAALANG